jgi:glutamate-1-semialdehyde 2,1-aminomutase
MEPYVPTRERVIWTCHALTARGFLKATEGNVSVRVPGRDAFAITPSNYDYTKMTMEDVCILDYGLDAIDAPRKPSIESAMHAAVYRQRADVDVVIHAHPPYASALAV